MVVSKSLPCYWPQRWACTGVLLIVDGTLRGFLVTCYWLLHETANRKLQLKFMESLVQFWKIPGLYALFKSHLLRSLPERAQKKWQKLAKESRLPWFLRNWVFYKNRSAAIRVEAIQSRPSIFTKPQTNSPIYLNRLRVTVKFWPQDNKTPSWRNLCFLCAVAM